MRRNLTSQNAARVALALGAVAMFGGYWHIQQQKVSNLQQLTDQLPDGKDKVALVKDRIALENTITISIVQGIGGLLLFVTVYVSLQNLKTTQQNVVMAQRNLLVSEEKQVTERFTQAINQLGSQEITVRVGGIYALERIAKDSPKDHWTIMEVLTSFIRESVQSSSGESEKQQLTEPLPKIRKDVQAALTVIGRREPQQDPEGEYLDLTRANLNGASLRRANLSQANLSYTQLSKADLGQANLSGALLIETNLSGADLRLTNLRNAYVSGKTKLVDADLDNAILITSHLNGLPLDRGDPTEENLILEQIKAAKNWEQAHYDDDFRQKLGLPPKPKTP